MSGRNFDKVVVEMAALQGWVREKQENAVYLHLSLPQRGTAINRGPRDMKGERFFEDTIFGSDPSGQG